jgi:hypothetical protein
MLSLNAHLLSFRYVPVNAKPSPGANLAQGRGIRTKKSNAGLRSTYLIIVIHEQDIDIQA